MQTFHLQRQRLIFGAVVCLIFPCLVMAADESAPNKEQIKHFLLTAKVVGSKQTAKGVTQPWRLTLSDGTLTHDASFQPIDEHKTNVTLASGRTEMNFVDSYKYNIAAYGSLSWWLPVKMDEEERVKQKLQPPDADAWANQMYKIRVFDQLVYDDDPNLTNVLIGADWTIWRVDFSRAFRLKKDLRNPGDLVRCDRQLFDKLKALDGNAVAEKTKHYLTKDEVKAVMARRDKIVAQFQKLSSEKGEKEVFY